MPAGMRLIQAASFDPETTHAMGKAYDQACAGVNQSDIATRELIAKRIIEAARQGERDVATLATYGRATALEEGQASQRGSLVRRLAPEDRQP
jgi:hypothetical protein